MTEPIAASGTPEDTRWVERRVLAAAVRIALFVVPVLTGAVAIWLAQRRFVSIDGLLRIPLWFAQAVLVGAVVATIVDRLSRRLLPYATLLGLSLTFPGRAPSRLGVALRAHNDHSADSYFAAGDAPGRSDVAAATETIELVAALGTHRRLTPGRTERLLTQADAIAVRMEISETEREKLAWSVLLHDIAQLAESAPLATSTGELIEEHTGTAHAQAGEAFVAPLAGWLGSWRFATSQHHERWDGTGYPKGIGGERITVSGRIVAVVDAFDSLTSGGRRSVSVEKANAQILTSSGTRFDPSVVQAWLESTPVSTAGGITRSLPTIALPGFALHTAQTAAVLATAGIMAATITPDLLALDAELAISAAGERLTMTDPDAGLGATNDSSTTTFVRKVDDRELPSAAVTSVPRPTSTTEPGETTTTTSATSAAPTTESTVTGPSTTTAPTTTAPTTQAPTTQAPTTQVPRTQAPSTTAASQAATTTTAVPLPTSTTTTAMAGPIALPDTASARQGRSKRIDVLQNDTTGPSRSPLDTASLVVVDLPAHGSVEIKGKRISYLSEDDFVGEDSFTYRICNELGACSTAKVTMIVR